MAGDRRAAARQDRGIARAVAGLAADCPDFAGRPHPPHDLFDYGGGAGVSAYPSQRRRHRFGGERACLRRIGARAQHRRRLCRSARPRLCRVFRDRRLCLRRRCLVSAATGVDRLLGAVSLARPRRADAGWWRRRRPFPGVILADDADRCRGCRLFRHPVRRADIAPQRRLPGDRDPGLWRDRPDRRAQRPERDQWRDGAERGRRPAALRLQFRHQRDALLLRRRGARRAVHRDQSAAQGFAHRARLDGDLRGRGRRRGDGRRPRPLQALGLCHRGRLCRRHRHLLRRQIADRDAGDVHVSGLGHDPGHDRVRRHRQCVGGRRRRAGTADAAIVVSRRFVAMAARPRPLDRHRLAAACRARLVDRTDLWPDPGADDALSPGRTDPGVATDAGAEP